MTRRISFYWVEGKNRKGIFRSVQTGKIFFPKRGIDVTFIPFGSEIVGEIVLEKGTWGALNPQYVELFKFRDSMHTNNNSFLKWMFAENIKYFEVHRKNRGSSWWIPRAFVPIQEYKRIQERIEQYWENKNDREYWDLILGIMRTQYNHLIHKHNFTREQIKDLFEKEQYFYQCPICGTRRFEYHLTEAAIQWGNFFEDEKVQEVLKSKKEE